MNRINLMKLRKIQEGRVKVWISERDTYEAPIFFNPEAELNRDISVCALQTFQKKSKLKLNVLDALSATGIRGLRYTKEISGIKSVTLNDKNSVAFKIIKKNIKENRLKKKCIATNKDANILMRENVFNVIDLDPFGSPNIFMDSAARSIYHKGFLAVTATDTAPLSGTYPEACFKKYGIKSIRSEFYPELGIRILISFIMLILARYDRAFVPLLSLATRHYFRVFGKIEHVGRIKDLLKEFGYVNYCPTCGYRSLGKIESSHRYHIFRNCGPVYLGNINDRKFCKNVFKELKKRKFRLKKEEERLLNFLVEESAMPAFYFDLHHVGKVLKIPIPKTEEVMRKLKKKGYKVSRTHFCLTAIKTDADFEKLKKIISQ